MKRRMNGMFAGGPQVARPKNFSKTVRDGLKRKGINQTQLAALIPADYKGIKISPKTISAVCQPRSDSMDIKFDILRGIEIGLGLPISNSHLYVHRTPGGNATLRACSSMPKPEPPKPAQQEIPIPPAPPAEVTTYAPPNTGNAEAVIDLFRELSEAEQDIVYLVLKLTR